MPAFLTLRAEPADEGQPSLAYVGRELTLPEAVHAVWFRWLDLIDPNLAAGIHQQVQKPFGLWPVIRDGRRLDLSAGILSHQLYRALRKIVELGAPTGMPPTDPELAPGQFQLGSVLMQVRETRLSEWVPDEEILGSALAVPERYRHLTLHFLTPTSFRQRGTQLIWPEARNVWGSLLRRWNSSCSVQLPPGLEEELAQLEVSAYQLKTQPVRFSRYLIIGFVGFVTYRIPPDLRPAFRQPLFALARFAKYAGVGYKSTMGLGRALWEEGEELELKTSNVRHAGKGGITEAGISDG